ncbi:MAG: putative transcriptional regulator [Rhodobacteraceae bacterium HLUCCA12]|nr:MAG: putative transcriptional regulator [Rhodobacteraceae bacterium HLUCCA12]
MSLATRLNQQRVKKGKSLQDVADAIGVSKTHIWELEKGRSENPSFEMLTKLANYFGVTIRFLVGEEIGSSGDEQLERMFRQVGDLDERDRALLDDMIANMMKRRGRNEN